MSVCMDRKSTSQHIVVAHGRATCIVALPARRPLLLPIRHPYLSSGHLRPKPTATRSGL